MNERLTPIVSILLSLYHSFSIFSYYKCTLSLSRLPAPFLCHMHENAILLMHRARWWKSFCALAITKLAEMGIYEIYTSLWVMRSSLSALCIASVFIISVKIYRKQNCWSEGWMRWLMLLSISPSAERDQTRDEERAWHLEITLASIGSQLCDLDEKISRFVFTTEWLLSVSQLHMLMRHGMMAAAVIEHSSSYWRLSSLISIHICLLHVYGSKKASHPLCACYQIKICALIPIAFIEILSILIKSAFVRSSFTYSILCVWAWMNW